MALGGRGGGAVGVAMEAFTASAKLLREEEVSFLRSSIFQSSAAMEAVLVGASWQGGAQWANLLGRSFRSAQIEQTSAAMGSVRRVEGYRTGQIGLLVSR